MTSLSQLNTIGIIEENLEKYKPGYSKTCPKTPYSIAELKISYALLQLFTNDNNKLAIFTYNMLDRIINLEPSSSPLYKSLDDRLELYADIINRPDFKKKEENFLALYNYLKYYWFSILYMNIEPIIQTGLREHIPIIQIYSYIHIIQQNFFKMGELIKATRYDKEDVKETENWGISSIKSKPKLKKNGLAYMWLHPGRAKCRVNYFGTYGKLMKEAIEDKNKYGSSQCGISGSVNFGYFLYFLSLVDTNYSNRKLQEQIINIIKSVSIILVGDGGHNVREILTGTAITIIPFYHFVNDLLDEISDLGITNMEDIISVPDTLCCKILSQLIDNQKSLTSFIKKIPGLHLDIFKWMVHFLFEQRKCINIFYDLFKGFNPIGVSRDDLNEFDPIILKEKQKFFNQSKQELYSYLLVDTTTLQNDIIMKTRGQIFFALEDNRYRLPLQKSFWDWPTDFFKTYIIPSGINQETKNWIAKNFSKCKSISSIKYDELPFAFKKSRKVRKTMKKSRKPKRSRKCKRGRRKSNGKCKPGPKRKSRKPKK
jgi:hypothetical protein